MTGSKGEAVCLGEGETGWEGKADWVLDVISLLPGFGLDWMRLRRCRGQEKLPFCIANCVTWEVGGRGLLIITAALV